MNRHHPYGAGGYENLPNRRGGSPSGPGPDRHRFPHERGGPPVRGRGGYGRGRGGGNNAYGGYDGGGPSPYDQGPPDGDMGYNSYASAPPETFYQNSYGGVPPPPVPASYAAVPDHSGGYEQEYSSYEDASGSNYDQEGAYNGRPVKRGGAAGGQQRRDRDDKVHDSIIEERIQRERPCRTLFIRNIKYETNSDDIRRMFEEHGEIKTFFDLIANRGMVFVTYHDLRAAERARERLQGSEISGRPIDVHYSLPRDDHSKGQDRDKNQALQGTLLVTLRNSMSGQPIDDNEVRRKFQQFGDVKSVVPVGDRNDQRYVEFYDVRAAEESYDRLRHQSLQDGVMDITLGWDGEDSREPRGRDWEEAPRRGGRGSRGGRGRGRGARGTGGGGDDWDRRAGDEYGRDRERARSFDPDYSRGGAPQASRGDRFESRGRGRGRGGYNNNQEYGRGPQDYGRNSQDYGTPPQLLPSYNGPPALPSPPSYSQQSLPPPPSAALPVDDRLEQARKVQQLLAALKQSPQNGSAPPTQQPPMPPSQAMNNYYQQPPPMSYPPPNQYPSQTSTPQPSQQQNSPVSSQGYGNLPPNILALIQQSASNANAQGYQQGPPPPQMHNGPPPGYGMPPVSAMGPPNPNSYQSMGYLNGKHSQ